MWTKEILILVAADLEIAKDAADMTDIDCAGGKKAEVEFGIGCNDDITFRNLERHMDKRSPSFDMRRDLPGRCQHVSGDLEERLDLYIPHQDDVAFFIKDRYGDNAVEFFDLPDNPDCLFIQNNRW